MVSNVCVACPDGKANPGGDNATESDTQCEGEFLSLVAYFLFSSDRLKNHNCFQDLKIDIDVVEVDKCSYFHMLSLCLQEEKKFVGSITLIAFFFLIAVFFLASFSQSN